MKNELQKLLKNIFALLDNVGESFWSLKIIRLAEKEPDLLTEYDVDEILSWFGGMGSLNDVYICKVNGHTVNSGDEQPKNDELKFLRSAIFSQAMVLKEELRN